MAHFRLYCSVPGSYVGGEFPTPVAAAMWADVNLPDKAPALILIETDRFGNRAQGLLSGSPLTVVPRPVFGLTPRQLERLADIHKMAGRPGGYLGMYEPDKTWKALASRGLISTIHGGRLTPNGLKHLFGK